ncbi:MAG TPA: tetratricopeptide repeat protein [Prosthecochloris aestuarii]|uniref:Tetratricopeptide repeat protein n=1 Tax=Prosthecochloris aestuarii TaxID=1102 RepID=A0A831SQM4_PROAE|nr:tetratricopeptide repeat protein [Prosthecochloris aestuarii]
MTDRNEPGLPQQDERETVAEKAEILLARIMKYQKQIIGAAAVIILVAAGIFYFFQNGASEEREASRLLELAVTALENGDTARAVEGDSLTTGLLEIANTYRATRSGRLARLMLARHYLFSGDPEKALGYFQAYSGRDKDLEAASLAGAASSLELLKKNTEAAETMHKAGRRAENPALKAIYLTDAATLYTSAGDTATALKLLTDVRDNYPDYTGGARAVQALQQLAATTKINN